MTPSVPAVAFAGAGPVARALGRLLADRGVRMAERAETAAAFIDPLTRPVGYADLGSMGVPILVAVSDDAIPPVARTIAETAAPAGVALHTCGAAGPEALAPLTERGWACGVCHPLQTIPTGEEGVRTVPGVPFGIGGDGPAVELAVHIVRLLDGRPLNIRPDGFATYHAAAVVAGNGMFALVDAALRLLADAGVVDEVIAAEALAPLCRRSLENALSDGRLQRLTGPVARGDEGSRPGWI